MNMKSWSKKKKFFVGVLAFVIIFILIPSPKKETHQPEKTNVPEVTESTVVNTAAPKQAETVQATPATITNATVSQSNALRKAKSYLSYSAFSYDGLVAQLEYEKFSHADAVYGADNVGANWNEQAAKKAKAYTDMQGYSRDGLITQLKYEKFTQAQAEFGASAVGL
jgi:Host cell surface-exposed lipoprotein